MTTAKAIEALREKLGISQRELAEKLGITVTSVSRYENGREPNRHLLKKLASVAESAKLVDFQDIFDGKWRAEIGGMLKNLPSAGTQRRVSVHDLREWQRVAHQSWTVLHGVMQRLRESGNVNDASRLGFEAHNQAVIWEQIGAYIHGSKGKADIEKAK